MKFFKYHALGNDYMVLDARERPPRWGEAPSGDAIRLLCHRNFGVGSDGILWGPTPSARAPFGLRIFNPDGSEAEKSGNGLRIFARYLWDRRLVDDRPFAIDTLGGLVEAAILDGGRAVRVDMGTARFGSDVIPVAGPPRDVVGETITAGDRQFLFSAVTVGNPHCVLPLPDVDPELARRYGPTIEVDPRFPNRTNVQFMKVLDRGNIRIEIWERGAGYTLASGSSASAATAVARRLDLVDQHVKVHMPGGILDISIDPAYAIRMTGPVTGVADGTISADLLSAIRPEPASPRPPPASAS